MVIAGSMPASAALSVERSASNVVNSASWAAVPALAGGTGSGALSINWATLGTKQSAYVDLVNTGTLDLSGSTLTLTTVRNSGGGSASFPTITVDACVGAVWNSVSNACAGTLTPLGSVTSGSLPVSIAIASGARLSLRLTSSGSQGSGSRFTTSLDVTVTRGQARPAREVSS
jgi:hypothetical protein